VPANRSQSDRRAFSATRIEFPGAVHVVLAGELDLATVPLAQNELRLALRDSPEVMLDLRALTFIDVAGLHMVLAASKIAGRTGRRLAVAHQGSECVQRMLEMTHTDRSLTLADQPPTSANGNGAHRFSSSGS
jgi:anti-anti-sigma factor